MVGTDSNTTYPCRECGVYSMAVEWKGDVCEDCMFECDGCARDISASFTVCGQELCYDCRAEKKEAA